MKRRIGMLLLTLAMCCALSACSGGTDSGDEAKTETADPFGTVEPLTVFDAIDRFNVELSEHEANYYADNEYMIAQDGLYWYRIFDDITCYVKPVEFSDDMEKDIAETIAIRYAVDSKNEQMALDYIQYLIKANNADITDDEISTLMSKAKEQAPDGKTAYNGKGITVGVLVTEDVIEYQIVRIYEDEK